jgi:hypothetical protein
MEYRIEKNEDKSDNVVYWVERKEKYGWRYVNDTGRFSAGEAWKAATSQIEV